MIPVRLRILDPTDARHLSGSMTFTPRSAIPGRTVTDDGALVSGKPIPVEVEGDDTVIPLRHTEPGWHYQVNGSDESGYRWTEAVFVPSRLDYGQESIDYGDLVRADPKALTAFTPDPEWWRITRELIRIIEGAGGVPGEPAKAAVERVLERSLTDTEFMEAIRGPRGIGGNNGIDGLTYLDWFRRQVDDPTATDAQYHEFIRGRTAFEQWAQFVGEDTDDVEVSDMFTWLAGDDAYDMWKRTYDQPDATLDDFYEFFRGPKGRDSTARGPQGDPGRDVFDLVVASGYEGTEEEFAGSVLGTNNPYQRVDLINGWSHAADALKLKVQDGTVHLTGAVMTGTANAPFLILPEHARPISNKMLYAGNQSTSRDMVRLYFFADTGEVQVHGSYLNALSQTLFIDMMWEAREQATRPRIPGPRGLPGEAGEDGEDGINGMSAWDFAVEDGYEGDQEHFAGMLNELGKYSPEQLQEFITRNELTRGPQGPRGYQGLQGPVGERGRGTYELVRDSGYEGTEEEFADELMGREADWQDCAASGGWSVSGTYPLRAKLIDGDIRIAGRIIGAGNPTGVIARLPHGMEPRDSVVWINARSTQGSIRVVVGANGNMSIHSADQSNAGTQISWDATIPGIGTARPRIPGPRGLDGADGRDGTNGTSAYDYARQTGWRGSEQHLADMFGALARYTPEELEAFLESTDRAMGPQGPRGRDRSAHEAILELARRDGWTAVYDPTNPDATTLDGQGRVTALGDGLEKLPALTATTAPPELSRNEYGQLNGLRTGVLNLNLGDRAAGPLTYMSIAAKGNVQSNNHLIGANQGNIRRMLYLTPASLLTHNNSGSLNSSDRVFPAGPHVLDTTFDGQDTVTCVDGQLEVFRGITTSSFRAWNGISYGGSLGNPNWAGTYGPLLVYEGPIPHDARLRMRKLLMSLAGIPHAAPRMSPEVHAYGEDADGTPTMAHGDPDAVMTISVASITKTVTALVARKYLTTDELLDERATVIATDNPSGWFQPRIQEGDQITYRDLLYLMAMPSDNDAPYVMARMIGQRFLSNEDPDMGPVDRFIWEMNHVMTQEWGLKSARARSPYAHGCISPRDIVAILRKIGADPVLRAAFGGITHDVDVTGPNARTVSISHTMPTGSIPGFAFGKTGTSEPRIHVSSAWQHPDGTEHYSVVTQVAPMGNSARRHGELRKAIYAGLSGHQSLRDAQLSKIGDPTPRTFPHIVNHMFTGITAGTVWMQRTENTVTLTFGNVVLPSGFRIVSGMHPEYRPQNEARGTLDVVNDPNKTVAFWLGNTGTFQTINNTSSDVIRGSVSWEVGGRGMWNFPEAPFPGIPTVG